MVEPRCPFCNATGVSAIAARRLGNALLLYCGRCGAIHGVAPISEGKGKAEAETQAKVAVEPEVKAEMDPQPKKAADKGANPAEMLGYYQARPAHGFYTRIADEETKDAE